jgi:uncharacterized protein YndB with AHSA1/START domain
MIEPIRLTLTVDCPLAEAFELFAERLGSWWPAEYTWSQNVLEAIGIEPRVAGMCFERGPFGFRCDWGRVLRWEPPRALELAWQISPRREPVPDPARASMVSVNFEAGSAGASARTRLTLEHSAFENHGDGAREYREAMASPQGWAYILARFVDAGRA